MVKEPNSHTKKNPTVRRRQRPRLNQHNSTMAEIHEWVVEMEEQQKELNVSCICMHHLLKYQKHLKKWDDRLAQMKCDDQRSEAKKLRFKAHRDYIYHVLDGWCLIPDGYPTKIS